MSADEHLPDHVVETRRHWDDMAASWVAGGERNWEIGEPEWGMWNILNHELALLPDDLSGQRAIELGCGTGYVSAWMRRRGASVYAIDNSQQQLATARRLAAEHGVDPGGIEFNMEISSWLRLFRTIGFDVVDYVEIQAPASAEGTRYWVGADWARRFPSEQAWVLQRQ